MGELGACITLGVMAVLLYTYVGYPAVVWMLSRLFGRAHQAGESEPAVSLLISAHNEAVVIRAKIENSLALKYPREKLQVRVISDGSDDGTDEIVQEYGPKQVELQRIEKRGGKANALNEAAPHARGEVMVLCDANTMLAPDALRRLVRHFADRCVGAVTGDVRLRSTETRYGEGESLFYRIERFVQACESRLWTVIGVDGGMYALRRELYVPNRADTLIDDFTIAMNVARTGARVVYDADAMATEDPAGSPAQEFRRRTRTAAGGFQALFKGPGRPRWNQPWLWLGYLSHKVLRWVSPFLLILLMAANVTSVVAGAWGTISWGLCVALLALQASFYTLAGLGWAFCRYRLPLIFCLPFYFCLANAAALVGFFKWLLGLQPVTWTHVRREAPRADA